MKHEQAKARTEPRTEEEQSAREEIQRLMAEQAREDFVLLMGRKEGRRFMWRLLERCRVFAISFVSGEPDTTAFREGRRDIGLQYLNDIHELCPEQFALMQKEANEYEELTHD